MKIEVDRSAFSDAFALAATAGHVKSPKEILQNVKLVAENDQVVLTATDMSISVAVKVDCDVTIWEKGAVLLPIARAGTMLRESTDEKLTVELSGSTVVLHGARSTYRLPSANPEEFPSVDVTPKDKYHIIQSRAMLTALARTQFACDPSSARYALGGVKIEDTDGAVFFVGTDGSRLVAMEVLGERVGEHTFASSTVMPQHAARVLMQCLRNSADDVHVHAGVNDIVCQTEHVTVISRLIEGRYPPWRVIVPSSFGGFERFSIPAGTMASAVRQAAIVADTESRGVDIQLSSGNLTVSASAAEVGDSKIEVPVAFDGESVSLRVDHRYVLDVCKSVAMQDELEWHIINDPKKPLVFKTEDGYLGVIMPMAEK